MDTLFGNYSLSLGKIKSGQRSISLLFKKKDENTNTRNLRVPKNQCFGWFPPQENGADNSRTLVNKLH